MATNLKTFADYPLDELKTVYQVLHAQIRNNPTLMDSTLLGDLQRLLQQHAAKQGIDVSLHAQWASWLNAANPYQGTDT